MKLFLTVAGKLEIIGRQRHIAITVTVAEDCTFHTNEALSVAIYRHLLCDLPGSSGGLGVQMTKGNEPVGDVSRINSSAGFCPPNLRKDRKCLLGLEVIADRFHGA